jgi:hypothetical protein
MIISKDGTKLFLCVGKTGSMSASQALQEYAGGVPLRSYMHQPQDDFHYNLNEMIQTRRYPSLNPDAQCYAFWREPVDRFMSAVNYNKRIPIYILDQPFVRNNPEYIEMLSVERFANSRNYPLKKYEYDALPQELRDEIENISYSTFLHGIEHNIWTVSAHFNYQSHWLRKLGNVKILDFHKFDSEMQKLVEEWGGNEYKPIRRNIGFSVTTGKRPADLERNIKKIYAVDYDAAVMPNF